MRAWAATAVCCTAPSSSARCRSDMRIVIPDEYQDMAHRLDCWRLLDGHEVTRYREPAASFEQLVERLHPAEVVVAIRERVEFSRALIERLPNLRLSALVGRNATTIDYTA